jgi:hypothetical protein
MKCCVNLDGGTQKYIVSHFYKIAIQEYAIKICKEIVAHLNMTSVITEKWGLDIYVCTHLPEHGF